MTEEKNTEAEEITQPGKQLKAMRMEANVSVTELAKALKLRPSQLEALENEQYEKLGPVTFVKGYIKSYGSILGRDVDPILAQFNNMHCPELHATPQSMQSFSRRIHKEESDNRLMTFSYAFLVIALGSSRFWWIQNNPLSDSQISLPIISGEAPASDSPVSETEEQRLETEGQPVTATDSLQHLNGALEPAPDIASGTSGSEKQNLVADSTAEAPDTPAQGDSDQTRANLNQQTQTETTEAANISLTMRFDADCWVEVYDGRGEKIVFGVKHPGHLSQVSGLPPFKITLGQPQAVNIELNGEAVDISHFPENKIARFELPFSE